MAFAQVHCLCACATEAAFTLWTFLSWSLRLPLFQVSLPPLCPKPGDSPRFRPQLTVPFSFITLFLWDHTPSPGFDHHLYVDLKKSVLNIPPSSRPASQNTSRHFHLHFCCHLKLIMSPLLFPQHVPLPVYIYKQ